jgi:hypothetical protein
MSRTITRLLITGCVMLSSACGDDSAFEVTGPEPESALASRGNPDLALPFHGDGTGWITSQVYAPGFPAERSTFEGRCSTPSDYIIEFSGTGQAAHLGKVTAVFEHCSRMDVDMSTGAVEFEYGDGQMMVLAANGDELRGTYTDGTGELMADGNVAWSDAFTLTGGTGRFAGASGSGHDTGTTHSVTGWTLWAMKGTITYDASR